MYHSCVLPTPHFKRLVFQLKACCISLISLAQISLISLTLDVPTENCLILLLQCVSAAGKPAFFLQASWQKCKQFKALCCKPLLYQQKGLGHYCAFMGWTYLQWVAAFLALCHVRVNSLPDPSLQSLCSRYLDPVIRTQTSRHLCADLSNKARLFHALFYK